MFLKRAQTCAAITYGEHLDRNRFPQEKELLEVLNFWDGGAREGCLLVEKTEDGFALWEYIFPYYTHEGELRRCNIEQEGILDRICAWCDRTYSTEEPLDFSYLTENSVARQFLDL